jgi:hypothetical protein
MPNGYTYQVEIEGITGFVLDTDLLDTGVLGYVLTDVTQYVRSVNVKRGRSTIQDKFTAGQMSVTFDNRARVFDPNYTSSPIYGAVKPRRRIIFTIATDNYPEGIQLFTGTIDSWSFNYDVSTDSTATVSASDGFTILSNQNITLTAPVSETSDVRFSRVLTDSSVNWPPEISGSIGAAFTIGTASYSGDALSYLQQLADSERGYLTVDGYGNLVFFGWNWFVSQPVFSYFGPSGGTAIPFTAIETTYDTDQFYNYVTVTGYPGTVTNQSVSSQNEYGISYGEFPVLQAGTAQMAWVATHMIQKFSDPRFRVTNLTVSLDDSNLRQIPSSYGDALSEILILASNIGLYVQVSWTPNNVGTASTQTGFTIGVEVSASPNRCDITFNISGDEIRGSYP